MLACVQRNRLKCLYPIVLKCGLVKCCQRDVMLSSPSSIVDSTLHHVFSCTYPLTTPSFIHCKPNFAKGKNYARKHSSQMRCTQVNTTLHCAVLRTRRRRRRRRLSPLNRLAMINARTSGRCPLSLSLSLSPVFARVFDEKGLSAA